MIGLQLYFILQTSRDWLHKRHVNRQGS